MSKLTILATLLFLCSTGFAQKQIKNFIANNTHGIRTISPDSTNYEELAVIGSAIGDARIVLLGEQDHGDAPTFLAKTRLVKYLHETKGFDVLAFESDFFALNEGWDNLDKTRGRSMDTLLQNNVLSLWAYCTACSHLLYDYIPATHKTNTPLSVTGFDNQTTYSYSRELLVEKLDSVLRKAAIPITKESTYESEVLPLIKTLVTKFGYALPSSDFFDACGKTLQNIKAQWQRTAAAENFWSLVIDNLIAFNDEEKNFSKDMWKAESIRDKQMFLNLKWLLDVKYANRKVIVSAANYHASRIDQKKFLSMGKLLSLDTAFSDKMYAIGFTSRTGSTGRLHHKKYSIKKPKSNSVESWLPDSLQYAFVDLAAYSRMFPDAKEKFNMFGTKYVALPKEWNKVHDGVFYIKEMYPCEKITGKP